MSETITKNPVQVKFFEKLKQSVPQNISLANEIADVLEISADGAYRRMRGESVLSMDELVKLCRHYKISPDVIASTDNTLATFQFQKMIHDEKGFEDYFKNILGDLQKINASNPKQIIYAAGDLPLFIQFVSPEYSAFKMFFWQRAVLSLSSVEGKKFSASGIKPEMAEMCKRISATYIQIPSVEIWHQDTIASNLNLIEFAWESGMFASKEDALRICKELSGMLALVEKHAEKASKFREEGKWAENEGNFTMYQSEFVLMNNHIFVTAGSAKILYLTHNTFNSMATTNSVFCCETEEWLKNLIRKSTQISGVGEKQRHKFFKISQEKISSLVSRISA
jgi:hypothetical protein